jgi:hypothetical protein
LAVYNWWKRDACDAEGDECDPKMPCGFGGVGGKGKRVMGDIRKLIETILPLYVRQPAPNRWQREFSCKFSGGIKSASASTQSE